MDKKKPLRDALYCSLLLPSLALSQAGQLEESSIDCDLTSNQKARVRRHIYGAHCR